MTGQRLMDSVRDEMAATKDRAVEQLGKLMTVFLTAHPEAEAQEGKTLSGAYEALREAARKGQNGGCYAMADGEALRLALGYYGISGYGTTDEDVMRMILAHYGACAARASAPAKAQTQDDLDIDRMLGGL